MIEKPCNAWDLGLDKSLSCAKNGWTDLNYVYVVWRVFCARSCLLRVAMMHLR